MDRIEEAQYEHVELTHDLPAIFPERVALQALIDRLGGETQAEAS